MVDADSKYVPRVALHATSMRTLIALCIPDKLSLRKTGRSLLILIRDIRDMHTIVYLTLEQDRRGCST